jgi:hypothetical protein
MSQLSIDFNRARKSDPATSHAAARKAERFAASQKGLLLAALKAHGPLSAAQMHQYTGLTTVQADRRRKDMIRAGLVRIKTMNDGHPVTHNGCEVWEAV